MTAYIVSAFCLLATTALFAALYWRANLKLARIADHGMGFGTLADIAPAGMWRTTQAGECVYVNAAWEKMAGLSYPDWLGHGWSNAVHPDDRERVLSRWIASTSKGEDYIDELRWQRTDGSTLWVMVMATPIANEKGTILGYAGINIDIQRAKEMEEELTAARTRAERDAKAKSTFLANMSHEIRTPMNGVIGFTELLLASDMDEDHHEMVQLIADSGHAMMQLLNDILDHSKIESGHLHILSETTDVRRKLKHCIKLIEPIARGKGLSVGCWVDDSVPDLILIDRMRLQQVILNLAGNAVKFTESGGIDIEARVENSSDGRQFLISVIDTGIGIEEARLSEIFLPFKQGDDSVARRHGGTGLGLAISSELITMMGGRITVQSKRFVGTQFTIRLPLEEVDNASAPEESATEIQSDRAFSLQGIKLLIAEDHSINQQLVMAMAASLKLDAHLVEDGEQAVEAVIAADQAGAPFAAVLMDMQMPGVDGLEATRRLRKLGYDAQTLPIIALTANCYPEDVAACQKAGMQSHLAKPVTTVSLARELARWLGAGLPPAESDNGPLDGHDVASMGLAAVADMAALTDRYRARRDSVISDLRKTFGKHPETTNWAKLADELHKLAGVAANFGEPELGEASRRLERRLKTTAGPETMMLALRREWPIFEKIA